MGIMTLDETHIEQLVLDELAGIISPEDSTTLKRLLEEYPDAIAIRNAIRQQFSGPEEQAFLALLPEALPIEKVWARIRKRKWIRISIRSGITFAAIALALGIYILFKPVGIKSPKVDVHSLTLKTVALQLPGGKIVSLGSGQQHVNVGGASLNTKEKQLSISGQAKGSNMATLIVPPGKDYQLTLSDGTSIQLNADSKIQFPVAFNGHTREVIISGEAYLNVAKDEQRPFIVHLSNSIIQVLGTEFNVNTYSNDKVALVKGAVKLSIDNTSVLVKPGYAASYSAEKGIQTGPFNEEELLAWRQGTYVFHAATVQELCKVVTRWYGINVKYDNTTTGQRRFTGYIDRRRPISHFLDDLEFTGHFNYYFDSDSTLHIR